MCCHSIKTGVLIASLLNNAQLQGTPYHIHPKLHLGACHSVGMRLNSSVGMRRGTDRHTQMVGGLMQWLERRSWPANFAVLCSTCS